MKQKIMICAGQQCFEFDGEITEIEEDYLILKANHGDIYVERKYLVFIQYLNEEEEKPVEKPVKSPETDAAAKFITKRLKHDPLSEKLEQAFIPPSQLPDDDFVAPYEYEDDPEVVRNIASGQHLWNNTAITNAPDLKQAIKAAMQNEDQDFSLGMGGSKYKNPAQTILGMKNANSKKDRNG